MLSLLQPLEHISFSTITSNEPTCNCGRCRGKRDDELSDFINIGHHYPLNAWNRFLCHETCLSLRTTRWYALKIDLNYYLHFVIRKLLSCSTSLNQKKDTIASLGYRSVLVPLGSLPWADPESKKKKKKKKKGIFHEDLKRKNGGQVRRTHHYEHMRGILFDCSNGKIHLVCSLPPLYFSIRFLLPKPLSSRSDVIFVETTRAEVSPRSTPHVTTIIGSRDRYPIALSSARTTFSLIVDSRWRLVDSRLLIVPSNHVTTIRPMPMHNFRYWRKYCHSKINVFFWFVMTLCVWSRNIQLDLKSRVCSFQREIFNSKDYQTKKYNFRSIKVAACVS